MPPNRPGLDMKASSRVEVLPGEPDFPFTIAGVHMDQAGSNYVVDQLAKILSDFLIQFFDSAEGVTDILNEFVHSFLPAHARHNFPQRGSTSIGGLLVVYLIARKLQPAVIVESGTFVGASLHALRKACPDADIWSFDVTYKRLVYHDETVRYCEYDWIIQSEPTAKSDHDLVFFDDHIDNAKRIVEAHARGFRYLLFDDAASFGQLVNYRFPGVPTIPMIMDAEAPRMSFSWLHGDTWLRYDHDPEQCERARELIDLAAPVPDVRPAIGTYGGDKWLVRLR
jgi:hypothetical protein